jgi:hypothetical protein
MKGLIGQGRELFYSDTDIGRLLGISGSQVARIAGFRTDPIRVNRVGKVIIRQRPAAKSEIKVEQEHLPTAKSGETYEGTRERSTWNVQSIIEENQTHTPDVLTPKATLCVAIARSILPQAASAESIEDQSISLMHLPDADLIAMQERLGASVESPQTNGHSLRLNTTHGVVEGLTLSQLMTLIGVSH